MARRQVSYTRRNPAKMQGRSSKNVSRRERNRLKFGPKYVISRGGTRL